jgi:hypothetical protein
MATIKIGELKNIFSRCHSKYSIFFDWEEIIRPGIFYGRLTG